MMANKLLFKTKSWEKNMIVSVKQILEEATSLFLPLEECSHQNTYALRQIPEFVSDDYLCSTSSLYPLIVPFSDSVLNPFLIDAKLLNVIH